jgi:hypothetical protein
MIYVCVDRKDGERIIITPHASRVRYDYRAKRLRVDGPLNSTSEYNSLTSSIFITEKDIIAMNFLNGVNPKESVLRLFHGEWERIREVYNAEKPADGEQ